MCKITKKVDIIQTLIALLTIGIAIYSFVSDARKKRRSEGTPPASRPDVQRVSHSVSPSPAAMPVRHVPVSPPVFPALPDEGVRVTDDDDLESFPYNSMEEILEEEAAEAEDLRNAIIWGEILQRKF